MDAGGALQQSKRVKCGEDGDANGSYQLGDFPDVILHRILSLLPTKDAVIMSLLSRRWQHLWLSIPVLYFEEHDLPEKGAFMNFAERTLLLRDSSSLEKFTLSCKVDSDASRINSWIASVMKRNVRHLSLGLQLDQGHFVLPYCLFRSETLMKLRLEMDSHLIVPSSVCLPSLKDLILESVQILDYGSVQNLLSSCPALENLSFYDCHWMDKCDVTILAPNLRTLSIDDECEDYGDGRECCSCNVVFNGPNVNFFSYSCLVTYKYYLVGSSSLNKTRLSLYHPDLILYKGGFSHPTEGLCKVKSLTLSAELFQKRSPYDDSGEEDLFEDLPIFCNMTELKLDERRVFLGSKRLANLLSKCPVLRILEIAEGFTGNVSQALEPVPPCLVSHLRKMVVRHFSPTKENADCVALLLSKATVLEEVVLYYHEGTTKETYKVSDLKKLPRGSKKCKISLIL